MDSFQHHYHQLNPQQQQAVDTIEGPVVVIAGAGTGKTQLLGMRAANILKLTDTLPSQILCLTFTDSASTNMKLRLQELIGPSASKIQVHTFHSFASDLINQYPHFFHQGFSFSPTDELITTKILHTIFDNLPANHQLNSYHQELGWVFLGAVKSAISDLKGGGLNPPQFRQMTTSNKPFLDLINPAFKEFCRHTINQIHKSESLQNLQEAFQQAKQLPDYDTELHSYPSLNTAMTNDFFEHLQQYHTRSQDGDKKAYQSLDQFRQKWWHKDSKELRDFLNYDKMLALADIYEQYQQALFSSAKFDFDDMILDVINVLQDPSDGCQMLKQDLQERYLYIMVDEFQDTNHAQMQLIKILSDSPLNEGVPNVMVVGDDDQAIFKFQGATLQNLSAFIEAYPRAQQILLETNYRSNQAIIDFAQYYSHQIQSRITPDGQPKSLVSYQSKTA